MMDDHLVTRTLERGDYHKGDVVDLCSAILDMICWYIQVMLSNSLYYVF